MNSKKTPSKLNAKELVEMQEAQQEFNDLETIKQKRLGKTIKKPLTSKELVEMDESKREFEDLQKIKQDRILIKEKEAEYQRNYHQINGDKIRARKREIYKSYQDNSKGLLSMPIYSTSTIN